LSASQSGWHVTEGQFRIGPRVRDAGPGIVEFVPVNGPGTDGAIAENVEISTQYGEEFILAFGTRDGWVFDIAFAAGDQLDLPVVSFVYFTAEERWFRSQFTSRTRSVAGVANEQEAALLQDSGITVLRDVMERSRAVIVPTDYVKGQLATLFDPTVMAKVAVVYHGVDTDLFTPGSGSWQRGGPWLHISRLSVPFAAHKNFSWSCEFLQAARSLQPICKLVVCGSGDGGQLIADFADYNDLRDRIEIAGFLQQSELATWLRQASILLVPSMMEAGCTVIVEAVLSGCLPVVLDHAGSGEVMRALGLDDFLIRPRIRNFGEKVLTVEPDLTQAVEVVTAAYAEPERVQGLLSEATKVAAKRYGLMTTTRLLVRQLDRHGLLGLDHEEGHR
jgi:glycosyltransferase involved in cell wall biosynthesis